MLIERINSAANILLPTLLDSAAKGAAILAIAGLATLAMRKASSSARHVVWALAVVGVLLLPVLSMVLPAWRILPAWAGAKEAVKPVVVVSVPAPAPILHEEPLRAPPEVLVPLNEPDIRPVENAPVQLPAPHAVVPVQVQVIAVPPPVPLDLRGWISILWIVGLAATLLPVLLSFLSLRRLARGARRIESGLVFELLDRLKFQIELPRRVKLLASAGRTMPMTWGIISPRILLPENCAQWTLDRTRLVLMHELAHVKRRDCLWQLLTQIVCGLYWFNPLAWVALRQMQAERERACDDLVLGCGTKSSQYAEQLLDIASNLQSHGLAAFTAIAMARPGKLEGRLLAILDGKQNRKSLTRLGAATAAILIAALAGCMAAMKSGETKKPGTQPVVSGNTAINPSYVFAPIDKSWRVEEAWLRPVVNGYLQVTGDKRELSDTKQLSYFGGEEKESRKIIRYDANGRVWVEIDRLPGPDGKFAEVYSQKFDRDGKLVDFAHWKNGLREESRIGHDGKRQDVIDGHGIIAGFIVGTDDNETEKTWFDGGMELVQEDFRKGDCRRVRVSAENMSLTFTMEGEQLDELGKDGKIWTLPAGGTPYKDSVDSAYTEDPAKLTAEYEAKRTVLVAGFMKRVGASGWTVKEFELPVFANLETPQGKDLVQHPQVTDPRKTAADAKTLTADPVAAVRKALPAGLVVQKVDEHSQPWGLDGNGQGTAIHIGLPPEVLKKTPHMEDESLILWIMPPEYHGVDPRASRPNEPVEEMPQIMPARESFRAANGAVYVWGDELLGQTLLAALLKEGATPATQPANAGADLQSQVGKSVHLEGRYGGPGKLANYVLVPGGEIYLKGTIDNNGGPIAYGDNVSVEGKLGYESYPPSTKPDDGRPTPAIPQDNYFIEDPKVRVVHSSGLDKAASTMPAATQAAIDKPFDPPQTDDVILTAEPEKAKVAMGEPLLVTLRFRNVGKQSYWVNEDFSGMFHGVFTVRDEKGNVVRNPYARSGLEASDVMSVNHELKPGGELTIKRMLNECVRFVKPGVYSITPEFLVNTGSKFENESSRRAKPVAGTITVTDYDRAKRAGEIDALVTAYKSGGKLPANFRFEEKYIFDGDNRAGMVRVLAFFDEPKLIGIFLDVLEDGDVNGYADYGIRGLSDQDAVLRALEDRLDHPEAHKIVQLIYPYEQLKYPYPPDFSDRAGLAKAQAQRQAVEKKYLAAALALVKADKEYRYGYLVPWLLGMQPAGFADELFLVEYLLRGKADLELVRQSAYAINRVSLPDEFEPVLDKLLASKDWSLKSAAIRQLVRMDPQKYLPILLDDKQNGTKQFDPKDYELLEAKSPATLPAAGKPFDPPHTDDVIVTAVPEKTEVAMGDPLRVTMRFRNVGKQSYWVAEIAMPCFFPDFTARDAQGKLVEDPYYWPDKQFLAVTSTSHEVFPGEEFELTRMLNESVRFERPGVYSIEPQFVVRSTTDGKLESIRMPKTVAATITVRDYDRAKRTKDIDALIAAYKGGLQLPENLPFKEDFVDPGDSKEDILRILAYFDEPRLIPFFLDVVEGEGFYGYASEGLIAMSDRAAVLKAFEDRLDHPETHNISHLLAVYAEMRFPGSDSNNAQWCAVEQKYRDAAMALVRADKEYAYGQMIPWLLKGATPGGAEELFLVEYLVRTRPDAHALQACLESINRVSLPKEYEPELARFLTAEDPNVTGAGIRQLVRLNPEKYLPKLRADKENGTKRFPSSDYKLLDAAPPATQPAADNPFEKELYELGAFPVAKLTKPYFNNGHPGQVFGMGTRYDIDGWLPPHMVEGYLTDAEKKEYGYPRKPLSYERCIAMLDVDTYKHTRDPQLFLVMRFALQSLPWPQIKKEDVVRVYAAGVGLEPFAVPLLKGQLTSVDAIRLIRAYGDDRLFTVIPAPAAGEDAYIAFLGVKARDEKLSIGSRLICFQFLFASDDKTYRKSFREFLLANVADKEWVNRVDIYTDLIGLKEEPAFAAIRAGLTDDPDTDCRNHILGQLQKQGEVASVMDAILVIANGRDKPHSSERANGPIDDGEGRWQELDDYLMWTKTQRLDDLTAKKVDEAINLLKDRKFP